MELKNKSLEVGATTKEAIDNLNQDNITHDNSVNQYPKHISFFLANIVAQMSQAILLGDAHD
jgi:hypothetical protein